jgi:uracil-DNA glycosylase
MVKAPSASRLPLFGRYYIDQYIPATMSLKRKAAHIATESAKKTKSNAAITSFFGQPKPNPSTSSTNPSEPTSSPTAPATESVKFDKDAWLAKLTQEQRNLLKLEIETLHESV